MSSPPLYACIPQSICADPRSHPLSPFEIAILGTLISLARQARGIIRHQQALDAGTKGIEAERAAARKFREAWAKTKRQRRQGQSAEAPRRQHVAPWFSPRNGLLTAARYKPVKLGKALKSAGSKFYWDEWERFPVVDGQNAVTIDIARTALLKAARLSRGKKNLERLDEALAVLSCPIRIVGDTLPPLCVCDEFQGHLLLTISAEWLRMQYAKVPLPLPIKSPLATHLFLWMQTINLWRSKDDSHFARFAEKFGYHDWTAQRAFDRAVEYLNDHYLPKFDHRALAANKIHIPAEIKTEHEGDRIRFVPLEEKSQRKRKPIWRERLETRPPLARVLPHHIFALEMWMHKQGFTPFQHSQFKAIKDQAHARQRDELISEFLKNIIHEDA